MVETAKNYDVIVIGAGPAGGQCARELAKAGRKVILLEHSQEIGQPNYSTAGTPRETVEEFDLPAKVLSATWNRIYFASTHEVAEWTYPETRGYVFDFAALKKFLAEDAARHGADTMVGAAATEFIKEGSNIVGLKYKGIFGEGELRAKYIVDATGHWGFANSQLHLHELPAENMASGIEVQVTGMPADFAKTLAFFVGEVAPQGYAWIFPMEESNSAKIGVGAYGPLPPGVELKYLLRNFLGRFEATRHLEPTEIHGGGGYVSPGLKDCVYQNIILVGDAGCQANALAYEGIRHAMKAGRLASQMIDLALLENWSWSHLKTAYEANWHWQFGFRWHTSYKFADMLYQKFDEKDWDNLVTGFKTLSASEAFQLFFKYRYELMLLHPKLAFRFGRRIWRNLRG
ncbi:MAG: NAD(P)/FAD-dependent oxidoreductase [Candidatus Kerfeldbacteria bacterium]|nr:NAD(P)/FAD-dependent oxidoreductase [Candidatus Kerfeldbacteria bacterium]